ncbi:LON peptidase substrate-binding domain-containing protein [Mycolicibacterium bacteremicum]|uniref:LON peptidase substrate-binding domain-containing protein n=1 Tax=Mycolicibacterium bacteremicum TaxID=564198 RepID=UPI0026EC8FDA|nr:LON peptidase substrate-binding domain-containing protein [Mycolicibacterium bacteremicum]
MFPLEVAMLPGEELPLRIFEPRYSAMISDCLAGTGQFGVVLIQAGREVGGGDVRSDVGALARIVEHTDLGGGKFRLRSVLGERIRVTQWLDDAPYPRAQTESWPDEAGPSITGDDIAGVEDTVMALFERIATARDAELPPREVLLGGPEPGQQPGDRLYALASRIPIGQADRYAVLAAPHASARLAALREAVETVAALVEFQLSE